MSRPPLTLADLPPATLDRIVSDALSLGASPLALLSQLGSALSHATRRVLAATLALPDDDAHLVLIERELGHADRRGSHLVTAVAAVWDPTLVHHLDVVPPAVPPPPPPPEVSEVPPLDDHGFLSLVDRFPNLASFAWRSYRLPPEDLCTDLANSAKNLRSFAFDLAPSPFAKAKSSPVLEHSPTFGSCPTSPVLHSSHALSLRWDSPSLSSLPGTLTSLALSSLSHAGIRELSTSLSSFFALEHLELSKTVFVDDPLLQEISQALAKTLKQFKVRDMAGTKLSDVGINALFEGCGELEEFEMDCVEGRLSKSCWNKVITFPPRLRSVKIVYSESPPHKSWVVDHLQSIPALLEVPSLTSFTLARKLHPESLVPGSHHPARHPVDPLIVPRRITREQIEAITGGTGGEGQGKRWTELDLDLCLVDADGLKKLLDGCPELRKLKVCFDSEFKNLLSLSSSFSTCLHLQRFAVSIPLEHTPELQTVTPSSYHPATGSPSGSLAASPSPKSSTRASLSPSTSPSKSVSDLPSPSSSEDAIPASIQALLPATRDWRRFLKKSHSLTSITWTGRGGIGRFNFGKVEGKGLIKITFDPTPPLPSNVDLSAGGGEGIEGGGGGTLAMAAAAARRERQDSWTSSFSFSSSSSSSNFSTLFGSGPLGGGGGSLGATPIPRRRASSGSSSVATTAHSPVTPTKSLGGGGGGGGGANVRKYGSIDAAFSLSSSSFSSPTTTHRRASTTPGSSSSGFGAIGPSPAAAANGSGSGSARWKASFDGGQIGSGWSGFHAPTPSATIPEDAISSPTAYDPFALLPPTEKDTSVPYHHSEGARAGGGGGGLQMNLGPSSSLAPPSPAAASDRRTRGDMDPMPDRARAVPASVNPWSSVPSSVTSPTATLAPIGWASKTPTPPHADNANGGLAASSSSAAGHSNTNKANGGIATSRPGAAKGPDMARGSRSSSSQGSPTCSRSSRGGGGGANSSTKSGTAAGGDSPKKDGSSDRRRRRDRGGRQGYGAGGGGGGAKKESGGGGGKIYA